MASSENHCGCIVCMHWKELCKHTEVAGRTDDPEAIEYEKAVELFREGLKLARQGDMNGAVLSMAKSCLLNHECFCQRLVDHLPPQDEEEAGSYLLERELGKLLADHVPGLDNIGGQSRSEVCYFDSKLCHVRNSYS